MSKNTTQAVEDQQRQDPWVAWREKWQNRLSPELIQTWKAKKFANNKGFVTRHHFRVIARLESRKDQERMLQRTVKKSLSARALLDIINEGNCGTRKTRQAGGGRRPGIPDRPLGTLHKLARLATRFVKFAAAAEAAPQRSVQAAAG